MARVDDEIGWLASQIDDAAKSVKVSVQKTRNHPSNAGMTPVLALAKALLAKGVKAP